jgi:hypothetical protein
MRGGEGWGEVKRVWVKVNTCSLLWGLVWLGREGSLVEEVEPGQRCGGGVAVDSSPQGRGMPGPVPPSLLNLPGDIDSPGPPCPSVNSWH